MKKFDEVKNNLLKNAHTEDGKEFTIDLIANNRHVDGTIELRDETESIELCELFELVENGEYLTRGKEIKDTVTIHTFIEELYKLVA